MRAHIDIGEVEARTKIRAKYLRAIENEEWDLLPGPVYVKSFLRTYGDYLGLDSRLLIDEYKRRYERPADHDSHPIAAIIRERERDARGPLMPSWAIIGVVLVAVVAVLFAVGEITSGSNNNNKPTSSTPITTAQHHAGHHKPTRPSHAVTLPKTTTTTATTTTSAMATLKLVATAPVYVCVVSVVNGHDKTVIPGVTYSTGKTIPEETANKLLITLGNDSVQMSANGKSYTVAPASGGIFLQVLPTGVTTLSSGPTCS